MAQADGMKGNGMVPNDDRSVANCADGSTVELISRSTPIWNGSRNGEAGSTFRPEIEAAVSECAACGHALCDSVQTGEEAATSGYIPFIGRIVEIFHLMTEEERDHYRRTHNVLLSPAAKLTSQYLPFVQALFSDAEDMRKKHKSKCTAWAQLARGLVEGCCVEPTEAAIVAFLSNKDGRKTGRSMAKRAFEGLPDIRLEREARAAVRADREAAKRAEHESKQERLGAVETALGVLASTSEDEWSLLGTSEFANGTVPLIQEAIRRHLHFVMPDGTHVTVRRVADEHGPDLVLEAAVDPPS